MDATPSVNAQYDSEIRASPYAEMETKEPIARFTLPLGHQDVELAEINFEAGGMALLRVRIREGKRFTIFDVDPVSAAAWGASMQAWAKTVLPAEDVT